MDRGTRGSGDGNAAAADHCGLFAWSQSVKSTYSADRSEAIVFLGISEGVPDLYSRARWRGDFLEARRRRVRRVERPPRRPSPITDGTGRNTGSLSSWLFAALATLLAATLGAAGIGAFCPTALSATPAAALGIAAPSAASSLFRFLFIISNSFILDCTSSNFN